MSNFRIYVGTYGKYNEGSIAGKWIELDNLDEEEFKEAIKELHKEEKDPEFMFQDSEVPAAFESLISESFIDENFWELKDWYNDQDQNTQDAFNAFVNVGHDPDPMRFEDAYVGWYESEADFCELQAEELGELHNVPDYIKCCIDWEQIWNSGMRYDYDFEDGYVFRSY